MRRANVTVALRDFDLAVDAVLFECLLVQKHLLQPFLAPLGEVALLPAPVPGVLVPNTHQQPTAKSWGFVAAIRVVAWIIFRVIQRCLAAHLLLFLESAKRMDSLA